MSDKPGGHDGETRAQAWDRIGDDIEDPFDKHKKSRGRYGWWDLLAGHATTNVAVAEARELPYRFAHIALYTVMALLVLGAIGLAIWVLTA